MLKYINIEKKSWFNNFVEVFAFSLSFLSLALSVPDFTGKLSFLKYRMDRHLNCYLFDDKSQIFGFFNENGKNGRYCPSAD